MKIHSYKVVRDYGFAPNPFYGICTLATCQYRIRNAAEKYEWVVGVGPDNKRIRMKGKLIYAMKVTDKITYNEYWNDKRFFSKKPVMNGSKKQFFGDNVYHKEKGCWIQEDSHHSLPDGKTNFKNLEKDTKSEYVLLSTHFYYFGKEALDIPKRFRAVYNVNRGHISKVIPLSIRQSFISWLLDEIPYDIGYHGNPILFYDVERFSGD